MDVEFNRRFKLEAYPEERRLRRGYVLLAVLATLCCALGSDAWTRSHSAGDQATERVLILDSLEHLDEVLTLSARMATLTSDQGWEVHYRDAARRLDEALASARMLSPGKLSPVPQIEAANQRLVSLEIHALSLARAGKSAEAAALLSEGAYESDKAAYAEGLRRLRDGLREAGIQAERDMRREMQILGAIIFAMLSCMAYVLYSNHRLLVRRIELEQALGLVAQRLIATEPPGLDGKIQSVLGLLAVRSRANQVWLLQQHKGPLPRLMNSWFHADAPDEPPGPKAALKALMGCEPDEHGILTLEAGNGAGLYALGVKSLEGVALESKDHRFILALLGSTGHALRWNHREAAILRSIVEVLVRAIENRELHEQLMHQATTDGLTNLPNRRQFTETLQRAWARARTAPLPTAVLMVDVDHFKSINDRHGHVVGDAALVRLAQTLREDLRDIDMVARIGGEEFAVLLPSTDRDGAMDAAERVRKRVEELCITGHGAEIRLTISVGVTLIAPTDVDAGEALKRADEALYAAKAAGRNRTREYLAVLPAAT